jgi:hypothetical protein
MSIPHAAERAEEVGIIGIWLHPAPDGRIVAA